MNTALIIIPSLLIMAFGWYYLQSVANGETFRKIVRLSPLKLKKAIQENPSLQLIDVRTPKEYKSGYIKPAKNIDIFSSDFLEKISKKDKSQPIYVYCKSGMRSGKASKQLVKAGFDQVFDLKGGYMAWNR
ncbi:MAG: phage shock protein E [Maribacter sp.]|jgi:phage shock protein E